MKKSILTIGFLSLVFLSSAKLPATFDLGLKTGINFSMISASNPAGVNYPYTNFNAVMSPGFDFGIFARLGGKHIYLQPEVLFSQINGETTFYSGSYKGTENQNLRTLKIPVLLGVKLLNLEVISVRAFTGPSVAIILKNSSINVHDFFVGDPNNYRNGILNWQLGAGVDIRKFTFDTRYELGLTNISDGPVLNHEGLVNKGNMVTFSIGYKFI